ncbi:hypothetical protein [Hydrogenophaga sp. BPS33]|uniref:hypothetical protein n=1 Tax=Hydrogenophaga sp. BPS33 TaxID=2651974 RepID=UPI0013201C73|nr:hypothetical protein [Hydrogenophaga sp. BPS33]QHE88520.1 hypothetical protein F9K07_28380 [Hydrogenophaga sp. BPS33]
MKTHSHLRRLTCGSLLAAVLALASCSIMPERVAPGTSRAEIESRLGRPTSVHTLPGGTRLQYSGQPSGQWVHNLDLGPDGRLLRSVQVLDIDWMQKNIELGRWTRDDVLLNLGRPALVERVARFDGQVWTYRFKQMDFPRLAHVHLDPAGVVRQLMFTDELVADDSAPYT